MRQLHALYTSVVTDGSGIWRGGKARPRKGKIIGEASRFGPVRRIMAINAHEFPALIRGESVQRDIIVIGASAGGIQALRVILSMLPRNLAAAGMIVVHRQQISGWVDSLAV